MIAELVDGGALIVICNALQEYEHDPSLLMVLLKATDHILGCDISEDNPLSNQFEHLGGIQRLIDLEYHDNKGIYNTVVEIMTKHFSCEILPPST